MSASFISHGALLGACPWWGVRIESPPGGEVFFAPGCGCRCRSFIMEPFSEHVRQKNLPLTVHVTRYFYETMCCTTAATSNTRRFTALSQTSEFNLTLRWPGRFLNRTLLCNLTKTARKPYENRDENRHENRCFLLHMPRKPHIYYRRVNI